MHFQRYRRRGLWRSQCLCKRIEVSSVNELGIEIRQGGRIKRSSWEAIDCGFWHCGREKKSQPSKVYYEASAQFKNRKMLLSRPKRMGTGESKLHVRIKRKKSVEKRPMICNLRLHSKDMRSRKQGLNPAALRLAYQASQGLLHRDVYSA